MKEIVIDYRFRGPPRSGNGSYVCGMLAKTLDDVVEVTLLKPVPLNVSLKITRSDDGGATLARGEIILASAKQNNLRLDGLAAASFAQADLLISRIQLPGQLLREVRNWAVIRCIAARPSLVRWIHRSHNTRFWP